MSSPIKIGISACLIGDKVRWNGQHKKDRFLVHTLGQYVDFIPVCPEVECGLGVPRETMRLVGDPDHPRLITSKTRVDHTARMKSWARERVNLLEQEDLCGFVFKKNSPSSGLWRVKVFNEKTGQPGRPGRGIFARAFTDRFPLVPVEEEGRLNDPKLRENFIEQIFTLQRWRRVLKERKTVGRLVEFHTRQKLLILSHSPKIYKEMGRLVAAGRKYRPKEVYGRYEALLVGALRLKSTPSKNSNVLQHILGYFKKQLTSGEKREMLELIDTYRKGHVPLIVPITLVNHYVRKYQQPYLMRQYYLNPHPVHLQLRNHV